MKVLTVGNDSSVKGGITSVITQIMNHDWSQENVDMNYIPTYIEDNLFIQLRFFISSLRAIQKELKNEKPDIMHMHMSYRGSFFRALIIQRMCKKKKVPVIVHLHGSEFEKWYNSEWEIKQDIIRRFLREIDSLIVLGGKWQSVIHEIEPKAKVSVIENSVKIPDTQTSWDSARFHFLFLGVLLKRKGVDDLIKALEMVPQIHNRIRLIIAGTGTEEANLNRMVTEYGLDGCVEFVGWVDAEQKKRLLSSSQLLILPSYNEGLPIAILEALSYGMPVLATDVGDVSSAVIDSYNGYLVKPGDVEAIADKLVRLVDNEDLWMTYSAAAKTTIVDHFSEEVFFSKIANLYSKCIDKESSFLKR